VVTDPSQFSELSEAQRDSVAQLVRQFDAGWDEKKLATGVSLLPVPPDPVRLPALVEMIKHDLEQHWQRGRQPVLEAYLRLYPELGTAGTVPAELIAAEVRLRKQFGKPVDWKQLARRFPGRLEELQRLVSAAPEPQRESVTAESTLNQPPTAAAPAVPEHFGRFRILQQLGRGGMGTVYLAEDTMLKRRVALKVPHLRLEENPEFLERFYREGRAAAAIEHPNICRVHDVGKIGDLHFLCMSYVRGQSLAQHRLARQPLPPGEAVGLVIKMAAALQQAHDRNVIHRDLKPQNVMIDERGEPVIMDFGLAGHLSQDEERLTRAGMVMGTPAYMPPEQVAGKVEELGRACDIYSLGVILYELLTGRVPFKGTRTQLIGQILYVEPEPPSKLRPELGSELDAICRRALAKKPEDRFSSMQGFAVALETYHSKAAAPPPAAVAIPLLEVPVAAVPLVAPPSSMPAALLPSTSPPARSASRPRWRKLLVPGGAAALVLLAGVIVLVLWPLGGGQTENAPPKTNAEHVQDGLAALARNDPAAAVTSLTAALRLDDRNGPAYFHRGRAHYLLGKYGKAVEDYDDALHCDRKNIQAHLEKAQALLARGRIRDNANDFDVASNECTLVLGQDPKNALAYAVRGAKYLYFGDFNQAINESQEALKLDDNQPLALAVHGRALAIRDKSKDKNLDEALDQCRRAVESDSKLAKAFLFRGLVYLDRKEFDRAIEDIRRAISLEPNHADAHVDLGTVYYNRRQYDKALAAYNKALELQPECVMALNGRANVYDAQRKYARAIADYTEALRLSQHPGDFSVYTNRGYTRVRHKDYAGALQDFEKALALTREGKNPLALHGIAQVYRAQKKPADALAKIQEAIDLDKKNPVLYSTRAYIQLDLNEEAAALETLELAAKIDPKHAATYADTGGIFSRKKDWERALKEFDKAIALEKRSEYYDQRAYVYYEMRQEDLALADYETAIELNPYNPFAHGGRALIKLNRSDAPGALADLGRAIELDPTNGHYRRNRAEAYRRLGRTQEADAELAEAQRLGVK
jgi:tetratricopeptide (TPR) repeat protein/tRNA A-37 threonylcarbamoyl transferase component Bud32